MTRCPECGGEIAPGAVVERGAHRECAGAARDFRRLHASCTEPPLRYFTGAAAAFLVADHPGAARRCGFARAAGSEGAKP